MKYGTATFNNYTSTVDLVWELLSATRRGCGCFPRDPYEEKYCRENCLETVRGILLQAALIKQLEDQFGAHSAEIKRELMAKIDGKTLEEAVQILEEVSQ